MGERMDVVALAAFAFALVPWWVVIRTLGWAGLSASGAFLLSSLLFALPGLMRTYLDEHAGPE